ncbi:endonuclease V, partial [bacterium]|nr:endonuclease V [bacterium]
MMPAGDHSWAVPVQSASRIQEELRSGLIMTDDFGEIDSIAGFDVAFSQAQNTLHAVIVVLDAATLEVRETASA